LAARRLEHGRVSNGSRRLHWRRDRRGHWTLQRELNRSLDPALSHGQGLELVDMFVVQHVAAAAGGLVHQERGENRHADSNGQPDS